MEFFNKRCCGNLLEIYKIHENIKINGGENLKKRILPKEANLTFFHLLATFIKKFFNSVASRESNVFHANDIIISLSIYLKE